MSRADKVYKPAITGKKLPILTLDNKWHRLFTQIDSNSEIKMYEAELNALLKQQGKFNNDIKDIKKLKQRLMDEIVSSMDEETGDSKKVEDNKRLINECNEKLEDIQDQMLDLPGQIDEANKKLMIATMEVCYDDIAKGTAQIDEISEWIENMRIELKKNVIRKQENQKRIQDLYAYMHDIFGADVIEIFDMKYNPSDKPLTSGEKPQS